MKIVRTYFELIIDYRADFVTAAIRNFNKCCIGYSVREKFL